MKLKKLGATALAALLAACLLAAPVMAKETYSDDIEDRLNFNDEFDDVPYSLEDQPYVWNRTIKGSAGSISMKAGTTKAVPEYFIFENHSEEKRVVVVGDKTWSTNRPEVATVSSNGTVTTHKIGTAKISVTYNDNRSNKATQTLTVRVTDPNAVVQEDPYYFLADEGKSLDLKVLLYPGGAPEGVVWASDRENVLSVDQNGMVMAERFGTGNITATHTDAGGEAVARTVKIKVLSRYSGEPFRTSNITLKPGDEVNIMQMMYPTYTSSSLYGSFSFTCDNYDVLSMDSGTITAKAAGSATITIHYKDTGAKNNDLDSRQYLKVKVVSDAA